jgi:pimeloyl-ACP methyl ester carboxylesterase
MNIEVISKRPTIKQAHPNPILFVHGMFINAWGWEEHFLDYFAAHGYTAHAISLRGHGRSQGRKGLRWFSLADYADDVAQVIATIPTTPILIGHSYGGAIVQKYLENHLAPAAVLLASAPPQGLLETAIRLGLRHPCTFIKTTLTLSLYPLVGTPDLAREMFFSASMPEEQVRSFQLRMSDESFRAFFDLLGLNLPKPERVKVPVLVIGAANDTSFRLGQVEATARAYHTNAIIIPEMNHGMMLEAGWQGVADSIIAWLTEKGL